MTKIDSSTLHNNFVVGSQENLQEDKKGANSMPTQVLSDTTNGSIVQSSPDEFDAVAKAESDYNKKHCILYNGKEYFNSIDWMVRITYYQADHVA